MIHDNLPPSSYPSSSGRSGSQPDAAWDAALDWLLRIRAAPGDVALRAALTDWLAADAGHAAAYRRAERVWSLTGTVAPAAALPRPAPRRRRVAAAAALAACLALAAVPSMIPWHTADLASGTAELADHALPDGSVVTLNAGSAVDSTFSESGRRVTLLAGEAFFDVRQDRKRPFSVLVDRTLVTVTGTAFGARLSDDAVTIEVEHGSVVVSSAAADRPHTPRSTTLVPGQRLTIVRASGASRLRTVPLSHVAAWRRHLLIADDEPLGDVIARLRPHLRGHLHVGDGEMQRRAVSGVFDLGQPVQALRAAVQPLGAAVYDLTPVLVVVRPQ